MSRRLLESFSRKPREILLYPARGVLSVLACSLLAIFQFELASPFCLDFKFSPADLGEKDCTTKISARVDSTQLASGPGERAMERSARGAGAAFLHQGGAARAPAREEEVTFWQVPPLD